MLRLLLVSLVLGCAGGSVCGPDVCAHVQCELVTEETCLRGRIIKNTGFCGCCDRCDHTLVNGHRCAVVITTIEDVPLDFRCPDGYECDHVTLTCQEVTAVGKRQAPSLSCSDFARQLAQDGLPGGFVPQCQGDGTYSPRQCRGSVCYCVDERGTTIKGYTSPIDEATNMGCECARDQHAYMQSGLIGKLFPCTDKGSYPQ